MRTWAMKIGASIEIVALLLLTAASPFLTGTAQASGNTQIRQEVNITDGYYFAASGATATTSEMVAITDNNYSNPAYYFEVVASTTAATNATIALVNPTTGATVASVTANGTSYTRYRSTQFLPSASTTVNYTVRLNGEAVGKGIIAARVIVLQNAPTLSNTETQIEIGDNETYTSTATSTFASPKYWYYNAAGWDGSPTFTASVTYANTIEPVGSQTIATTTYTSSQSVTLNSGNSSTKVMLWGAGGAGGPAAANPSGGAGGSGGQFAQSTITGLAGLTKTLTIGGATAGCTSGTCSAGADTTWDSTVVVAKGGAGGGQTTASTTGSTTGCVGSNFCVAGGDGGAGKTTYGAGGGGGPGVNATGNSSTGLGIAGTASTDGNGGAGGDKNTTSKTSGNAGNNFGAGGGGAFRAGNGGTVTGGQGAQGKAIIVETIATLATTTVALQEDNGSFGSWTTKVTLIGLGTASSPTQTAAVSFTPTDGKHYRIAFNNGYTGATFAIYNAKIIVDQAGAVGGSGNVSTYSNADVSLTSSACSDAASCSTEVGETFIGTPHKLSTATFVAKKVLGSPTGNATVKIYNTTGSAGNKVPTGAALATSNTFDVSTLTTTSASTTFTFSGANQITFTNGTEYAASFAYSGGDASNKVGINGLSPKPFAGGDGYTNFGGSYAVDANNDFYFSIDYNDPTIPNPTLLEPTYLLANTKYAAGTNLQNYITDFDPTEWTTTNNYLHAVDAAASSASVAGVYDTSGTLQVNSTITSPNNFATSTLGICMPSVQTNLDTKATTNNNDIYADEIIVQVGVASTATGCSGPAPTGSGPSTVTIHAQMIIREPTVIK